MPEEINSAQKEPLRSQVPSTREIPPRKRYANLLAAIQDNPYSDDAWIRAVELARTEKASRGRTSFYTHIPLEELITVGQRLRSTRVKDEQYNILTEKASTKERWYDIVLGHVNDKSFAPIAHRISSLAHERGQKWEQGLDVGTGAGNTIAAIAPYFERAIGVDRLESVLHKVKAEGDFPANADAVVGDATQLPFDRNVFDVAVSNGLTHYLSQEGMQRYIRELARVIKPGGLYFESFVTKGKDDLLPRTEQEYLTSAKALLTCLIDNLVSQPDPTQSQWSLREMIDTFKRHGFEWGMSEPNEEGVWFLEFHKKS